MKILIMIPAYNEEGSIKMVADNIRDNFPEYDFVVINDGSRDRTADICRENAYPLLDLPVNLGLTGAFRAGMLYAYKMGYDAAIQIDGDGQHDPAYIAKMAEAMEKENADIVIGSRFCEKEKPKTLRMLGSNLISFAIRATTGKVLKDPTSGMRLFNKKMIEEYVKNVNYIPEPDTISHIISIGGKVIEVQAEMKERMAGESYLNLSRSVVYMTHMFISILFIQFFRFKR